MTSAADKVLSTFELLDHVLSHLDWRTIVRAQRVSQYWKDVIAGGTSVQKVVGFKSIDRRQRWALRWNDYGIFISSRRVQKHQSTLQDKELLITCTQPTSVFEQLSRAATGRLCDSFGDEYMFKWSSIPSALLMDDEHSSWRNMLICQPPATQIEIYTVSYYRDPLMFRRVPGHKGVLRVFDDTGITLGQVMSIVQKWKAEAPADTDWDNERFAITTVHMMSDIAFLRRLQATA